jgi:hypothetical protein
MEASVHAAGSPARPGHVFRVWDRLRRLRLIKNQVWKSSWLTDERRPQSPVGRSDLRKILGFRANELLKPQIIEEQQPLTEMTAPL